MRLIVNPVREVTRWSVTLLISGHSLQKWRGIISRVWLLYLRWDMRVSIVVALISIAAASTTTSTTTAITTTVLTATITSTALPEVTEDVLLPVVLVGWGLILVSGGRWRQDLLYLVGVIYRLIQVVGHIRLLCGLLLRLHVMDKRLRDSKMLLF